MDVRNEIRWLGDYMLNCEVKIYNISVKNSKEEKERNKKGR